MFETAEAILALLQKVGVATVLEQGVKPPELDAFLAEEVMEATFFLIRMGYVNIPARSNG